MNRTGGRGGKKTQKEKKKSSNRRNKERMQRQGYKRETKKTHIDTETRTTGNKSGACVRGHTKTLKLVAIVLQHSINQSTTYNAKHHLETFCWVVALRILEFNEFNTSNTTICPITFKAVFTVDHH